MFPRLPSDLFSFEGTLGPWAFIKRLALVHVPVIALVLGSKLLANVLLPSLSTPLDGYVAPDAPRFLLTIVYLPLALALGGAAIVIAVASYKRFPRWFRSRVSAG